jgi:acetyl-CoA synthetase
MGMEDIKPKEASSLENLRSLSVGEPLHAEAVIWGEENLGSLIENWWQTETVGIMIANYPSMKVNPVLWENLCLG